MKVIRIIEMRAFLILYHALEVVDDEAIWKRNKKHEKITRSIPTTKETSLSQ